MFAADSRSHKHMEPVPFHIFMIDLRERNTGNAVFLFPFILKAGKQREGRGFARRDALLCRSALQRGFLRQRGKRESSPSKKDKETGGFLVRNKIL